MVAFFLQVKLLLDQNPDLDITIPLPQPFR